MMRRRVLGCGLACGLAAATAGCGGNGGAGPGGTGDGGAPRQVTSCSVTGDATLGSGEAFSPVIAAAGDRFGAAWIERDTGLHFATIDGKGDVEGTHALETGAHPAAPAVAALPDGGFLVVWEEAGTASAASAAGRPGMRGKVGAAPTPAPMPVATLRAMRLAADGTAMGGAFTLTTAQGGDPRPTVASGAGGTAIAWADAGGVSVATLNGTALDKPTVVAGASDPALVMGPGGAGLSFATGNKLGFAKISLPVRAVAPALFREAAGKADVPRASAAEGGGYFVTWEDDRGGNDHEAVYLTLVGADGKPGAEVSVPSDPGSANYPDVATIGQDAAVVYYQFRDGPPAVYLSLVGPDLHRIGSDLQVSDKGARYPRIAATSAGALGIAYARKGNPAQVALVSCR